MAQIFSLIIGYFIGALIQTSYWYGKRQNIDIRNLGSGNAGTSNAMRTMGRKAGIITAAGDVLKVFLSALICWLIFRGTGMPTTLIFLYSGLGTIIGHNFPFFMGFKGGKGVATTAGVIISLFFQPNALWVMTLVGVITFFGVLILTRYASLASLVLVTEFMVEFIIWSGSGNTQLRGGELAQGICLVIIITALCYQRHLGNIERLLDGNERRFGEKKPHSGQSGRVREKEALSDSNDDRGTSSGKGAKRRYYDDTEQDDDISRYYTEESAAEDDKEYYDHDDFEVTAETDAFSGHDRNGEQGFSAKGSDDGISDPSFDTDTGSSEVFDHNDSPVRRIQTDELEATGRTAAKRKYIWDAEKQCYVRYRESDADE